MKQITMDYETYEAELIAAKKEGFALTRTLEEDLTYIARNLDCYVYEERERAIQRLHRVLRDLNSVRNQP